MGFLAKILGKGDASSLARAVPVKSKDIEAKAPNPGPKDIEAKEPTPGPKARLSPLSIVAIERLADNGDLRLAADLCREFMGDGRVQSALSQRIGGLLALPLSWEDGVRNSARARKAIVDDFPEGLRECDLFQLYSWGLLLGVAVAEILWKEGQSGRFIPTLKVWDPRWLRFDHDEGRWKVEQEDGPELEVTPGDGHWVLYAPRGERYPWRNGLWKALNKPFFVKADASLTWARYNEVHGSPLRVFTGTQSMSQRQLDAVADSIDTSRGFTSAAIPSGSTLALVEATGNTWNTFQAAIEWAGAEISIAILGQNLTTQVDGGSLAASKTHLDVEKAIIEADAETESTFLREQVLGWWAAYNFGDSCLAPWPRRQTEEPEDLNARAELLKGCGEAILSLKTAGFAVDLQAIAEEFGIPIDASAKTPPETQTMEDRAAGRILMASGGVAALKDDLPKGASNGFDFIDAMADRAEGEARKAVEDASDIIMKAVEKAKDPDDLERLLKEAFVDMESGELNGMLERALILADIEGRWSVMEDI